MFSSKQAVSRGQDAIDRAASTATQWTEQAADALSRSRSVAEDAYDSAQSTLRHAGEQLAPGARQLAAQAQDLASRGIDAARYGTQQVREAAATAAYRGSRYVRDEPLKSAAIAALTGVAVYAIVRLINQSRYGR